MKIWSTCLEWFYSVGQTSGSLARFSWSASFLKPTSTPSSFARKLSRCQVAISCLVTSRRKLRAQSGLGDRNSPSTVTCFPNCVLKCRFLFSRVKLAFCKICTTLFSLYSKCRSSLPIQENCFLITVFNKDLTPLGLLQIVSGREVGEGAILNG